MNRFSVYAIGLLVTCLTNTAFAQSSEDSNGDLPEFTIRSSELDREYLIRTNTASKNADELLPAIYILDGHWEYELASAVYGALRQDGFVPEAVLVGVCVPGSDESRRSIRSQDFAPQSPNGDGKDVLFRQFLSESIVPEVEKRYPCNTSKRTLVGWSMGGMFAIETMLSSPNSFRNYVAISPALFWDQNHASNRLRSSDFQRPTHPVSLWMSIGEFEPPYFQNAFRQFEKSVATADLAKVELIAMEFEKERHFSARAAAYTTAFKQLFGPKGIELSESELRSACGTYRPAQNEWGWWGEIEIGFEQGTVWASRKFPGFEGRDALIPVDQATFVGTRYGSRFSVGEKQGKPFITLKWEEFPPIELELVDHR